MPIYEYLCQSCSHELEALQKVTDEPLEKCPSCGEMSLRKKVSAAAFRLKGGGWYETDFKTGDKKNLASDAAASATGADAAGAGKDGSKGASAKGDSAGKAAGKSESTSKDAGKKGPATGSNGNSTASA